MKQQHYYKKAFVYIFIQTLFTVEKFAKYTG